MSAGSAMISWNDEDMGAQVNVIGLGYEGESIEQFCARASAVGVAVVVDVRLNALSRKRGFSKNGLRDALRDAGIEYQHFPVLGNPRDNRDGFGRPGTREGEVMRDVYRDRLRTPEASEALAAVLKMAEAGQVALLCFERDESHCHRQLILAALTARSITSLPVMSG